MWNEIFKIAETSLKENKKKRKRNEKNEHTTTSAQCDDDYGFEQLMGFYVIFRREEEQNRTRRRIKKWTHSTAQQEKAKSLANLVLDFFLLLFPSSIRAIQLNKINNFTSCFLQYI